MFFLLKMNAKRNDKGRAVYHAVLIGTPGHGDVFAALHNSDRNQQRITASASQHLTHGHGWVVTGDSVGEIAATAII